MSKKLIVLLVLLGTLVLVTPAAAGGWTLITVDHLPSEAAAGEKVEVTFTLLQHGQQRRL